MDKEYTHPSYGVIRVSKVTGNQQCFMSEGEPGGYIEITVGTAELRRHLSNYWLGKNKDVVKLRLTYAQFAEMISNPNVGDGVPCTLEYITPNGEGKVEEYSPPPSPKSQFEAELGEALGDLVERIKQARGRVKELIDKGKANKGDLLELSHLLERIASITKDRIPFIEEQFQEAMDNAINEGKVNLASWLDHQVMARGLKGEMKEEVKEIEGE